jgi:hypothetical protein
VCVNLTPPRAPAELILVKLCEEASRPLAPDPSGWSRRSGCCSTQASRCAPEAACEWFAENRYQDNVYLHGLAVEMTQALA